MITTFGIVILGVLPLLLCSLFGTRFEIPLIFGVLTWFLSLLPTPSRKEEGLLILRAFLVLALFALIYGTAIFGPARI